MAPLHPVVQMGVCVGGIYASFLIWALCQERLSTTPYESILYPTTDKFRSVIFLNTIQSLFSALSAFLFLYVTKSRPGSTWSSILGLPQFNPSSPTFIRKPNDTSFKALNSPNPATPHRKPRTAANLLKSYAFISLVASLASPFGFLSLSHISFPTLLLGKSSKLVPVMLMNIVLYGRKYPLHKYVLVAMVTVGIWAFMAFKDDSGKKKKVGARESSSLLGLGLLAINLLLDGVVNSTQDEVFSTFTIDGPQMMFWMNVFSTIITTVAMLFPAFLTPSFLVEAPATGSAFTSEPAFNALSSALSFIAAHPGVTPDILLFSLCGAVGQLFIFVTLSMYGSLTLVTITVTRKMVTMLLSLFIFNHKLTGGQWAGVGLVFGAVVMEARAGFKEKKHKKRG